MFDGMPCKICGTETIDAGTKVGTLKPTPFYLRHCPGCRFSFVANPWTEFDKIYSAEYYAGKGADPLVDYVFEMEHPDQTIRIHEWRGITRIVRSLAPINGTTRWLDFGCGNGGLVRYVREHTPCQIVGFEEGWIQEKAARLGIPFIDAESLKTREGEFDIITAIEVLEHVDDPIGVLKQIRRLLKSGGLFFCTTGNARPFRDRLTTWRYVRPEIHISFYEPESLAKAMTLAGLQPEYRGFMPGYADVIRFKLLKNFGIRKNSLAYSLAPWGLMVRVIDQRLRITGHPIAWAGWEKQPALESHQEQYA